MFKNIEMLMDNLLSIIFSAIILLLICFIGFLLIYIIIFACIKGISDVNFKRGFKNGLKELYLNLIFKNKLENELNQALNNGSFNNNFDKNKNDQKQKLIFKKIKFKLKNDNIKFEIQTRNIITIHFLERSNKEYLEIIRLKISRTLPDYNFSNFIYEKNGYILKGKK